MVAPESEAAAAKAKQADDLWPARGGNAAITERRDDLAKHEFMLGPERGRLAISLDMLTDALILVGQHGVYCVSHRNPSKPALDLQAVLDQINGAKQLIQSAMQELERKREQALTRDPAPFK